MALTYVELDNKHKETNVLYWCGPSWIDCMIIRVTRGAPYLSLYRGEGKGMYLVLVGHKRRVLVLLQNPAFIVSLLSRSRIVNSNPPCLASFNRSWAMPGPIQVVPPWGTPRTLVRQAPERVMVELGSLLVPPSLAE